MSVSFLRIDDRMIHGQTVTRWSLEYPMRWADRSERQSSNNRCT